MIVFVTLHSFCWDKYPTPKMKEGKVYLAHSYWRFQSIFGWPKSEWNRAEGIQFRAAEQQKNGDKGNQSKEQRATALVCVSVTLYVAFRHFPLGYPP